MVKSGDRSDKIRTYNFPQNRVTDHRIGLTLYNLAEIIDGRLDELAEALKIADRAERLNHRVETVRGISEAKCGGILKDFFEKVRKNTL